MNLRPFAAGDVERLCALVDADRLPGQPDCTAERVAAVLAGRSRPDAWWWRQLATMRVAAAESDTGELVGAGAIGRSAETGRRYLLWLHAREDRRVVDALLAYLFRGARRIDPIYAFWFGSELSVGLEGLPRGARPATHEALVARGFAGEERWLYLHSSEAGPKPAVPHRERGHACDLRVEVTVDGQAVGGIEVGLPAPGLGVLWWLEVDPAHRGRGLGRQLLRAARHVLAEHGARETILFVDRDDRGGGWRPALQLYLSEGFTVVDHLWSYRRGDAPDDGPADG